MPAINVDIKPEIIQWALSQTEESRLGSDLMSKTLNWLDGTKTPTFKQIETFSKKTNIPLGYFFLRTPPVEKLELLEFRTVDSVKLTAPSRELIDTIHEMDEIQNWMKKYRQETGFEELSIVGSMKKSDNVIKIAEKIRTDLDLEKNWYENCKSISETFYLVRTRLEQSGVIVMLNGIVGNNTHRTLSIDEFRAFAMVDKWAPLIFINNTDSQGAKLFSLFHEIAHIWLGENDFFNDRKNSGKNENRIEVICNAVAGELLVPGELFDKYWKDIDEDSTNSKLLAIAKIFKCSDSVVARRALDKKKISQEDYDQVIEDAIEAYIIQKENKTAGGGNYYNNMAARLDSCLVRALIESIRSGRTSYMEAYRLTNTNSNTFAHVVEKFGGVG